MITAIIRYKGKDGNAKKFVSDMVSLGLVDKIRLEEGNLQYEYFFPIEDEESVLLIDSWVNQEALDCHHQSPFMAKIAALRDKYDLHMEVHKHIALPDDNDRNFIRS